MLKISLLTIISATLGFLALLSGGTAELHSIEVGWSISVEKATFTIDPVFVIWEPPSAVSRAILYQAEAITIGNTIFVNEACRDHPRASVLLRHEFNHVLQQRAAGMFTPLLYPFANMEGEPGYSASLRAHDIDLFEQSIETMWRPPPEAPELWHTLQFSLRPVRYPVYGAADLDPKRPGAASEGCQSAVVGCAREVYVRLICISLL
jgi:hypothetical protein